MNIQDIIVFVNIALILVFGFIILNWLHSLDKNNCKCSNDNKKTYIKLWWFFLIIYNISVVFMYIFNDKTSSISDYIAFNDLLIGINTIFGIFSILILIITYLYINNLKKINCKCSFGKTETFLYYYTKISIFIFISFLILFILSLFYYLQSSK